MTDIASVFKGRSGPYDKGLRVQVVAVGRPITYTGRDSQVKQVLAAAISDSKDVIKVSCYDPSKFRFFQEEASKMVKVSGEEVKIQNVVLEDDSGCAKITLWRELATADIRTGEFVEITNLQTNFFMDQTSLSTTIRFSLQKIDAPECQQIVKVVGISLDDGNAKLFLDGEGSSSDATEVIVPAELLQLALTKGDGSVDLELACDEGPFKLIITRKGTEVLSIVTE